MFEDQAVTADRDVMLKDLVQLAVKARQYYYRPVRLGGGGYSFIGLSGNAGLLKITNEAFRNNDNGEYTIVVAGDASHVVIRGTGKVELSNGDGFPTVEMDIMAETQVATVIQ